MDIIFGMKKTMKKNKGLMAFISLVVLFVFATIVIGFVLIGSPVQQRLKRLDDQRSNALNAIDSELITYWNQQQDLPDSLAEIEERIYDKNLVKDPETKEYYTYTKISKDAFKLCANFALENTNERPYLNTKYEYINRSGTYYEHAAGTDCYDITLDIVAYEKLRANNNLPIDFPVRVY